MSERQFPSKAQLLFRQLRPHQWSKNLLIFVPFLSAHQWQNPLNWIEALWGFLAFSMISSSVYILNDLCDLDSDKKNPLKKHRPLASGSLKISHAVITGLALASGSFLISLFFINTSFVNWIFCYLIINLAYSFQLKKVHTLDVICLTSLYTIRIMAGGAATQIDVSYWLLAFSLFLFLSLALIKRSSELQKLDPSVATRRDYNKEDIWILSALGAAAAYSSVLILALYLHSPEVTILYSNPNTLWLLTPLSIYWLTRLWILAQRQKVHEDPVLFALKDPPTWIVAILGIFVLAVAK